jgi:hypothetical protein
MGLNRITKIGYGVWVGFMVFNATFNNISVISLRSVLLVEGTGIPEENHRPGYISLKFTINK